MGKALAGLLSDALRQGGIHGPGADRAGLHLKRGQFRGRHLRKRDDRRLGDGVGAPGGRWIEAGRRGDGDDLATSLVLQDGRDCLDAEQHAFQVDGEDPVPLAFGHLGQQPVAPHTGVGDEHIQLTERRQGGGYRPVHLCFHAHIGRDGQSALAGLLGYCLAGGGHGSGIAVQQGHAGAGLGQRVGYRFADATGGAGH